MLFLTQLVLMRRQDDSTWVSRPVAGQNNVIRAQWAFEGWSRGAGPSTVKARDTILTSGSTSAKRLIGYASELESNMTGVDTHKVLP